MTMSSTPTAVRRYLDGLNALDPAAAEAAFAPNAVIHYPGMPPMSRDAFRAYLDQVKAALRGFEIREQETFVTEHGAAARWSFEATTKAGRTARCEGIDSWVIGPDGTIQEMDVYYDPAPLLRALQPA